MPVIYCIIHERFVKFAPRSEPPHIENPNLTPGCTVYVTVHYDDYQSHKIKHDHPNIIL